MSDKKDIKRLIKEAERQGWRVVSSGKHHQCFSPDGQDMIVISKTPSDKRSFHNSVARLRRSGFIWKGR